MQFRFWALGALRVVMEWVQTGGEADLEPSNCDAPQITKDQALIFGRCGPLMAAVR
jgi:hypothetical protein